jgi:protein-S-isoprenylcysteine O-methyltransferase Ste14
MELFPQIGPTLLGGWIFLVILWLVPGITLITVSKSMRGKLTDRSNFSRKQKMILIISKILALIEMVIIIMTPLNYPSIDFGIGITIYILGLFGLIIAILNYVETPLNEPVIKGIYRISRNPQEFMIGVSCLGICFLIGSGIALFVLLAAKVFTHFTIVAEEEACIRLYGKNYEEYMEKVPRYFIFF